MSFDIFWAAYPRRIAKGAARKAFAVALRKTTLEIMLAAIEQYKRHKPEKIDYCHPATWLNGERWEDQWEEPQTIVPVPIYRKAKSLDELRAYHRSRNYSGNAALKMSLDQARSLDDISTFAQMIPVDWQPSNVTQMRRV